jgi:hypothetical protein
VTDNLEPDDPSKFELRYWVAQEEYGPNKLAKLAIMAVKAAFAWIILAIIFNVV